MKKFSIITVCLNEPRLERTCESIVNQTYQDFEWIVIDGGSNAATLAIFEKYKSRIDYFVSEPDGGIYFGMNKGIKQATGEWLNFMNAGDSFYASDTLNKVVVDTEKCAGYSVLYGGRIVDNSEKDRISVINVDRFEVNKLYFVARSIPHGASFIKKNLFDKFGYYRTDFKIAGDVEFFTKLCLNDCKFKSLKYYIQRFDASGISSLRSVDRERHLQEADQIHKEYFTEEEIALGKRQDNKWHFQELRERLSVKR